MYDADLRNKALTAREERLGSVDALRFLALVRREPFNCETWRAKTFADQSIAERFEQMQGLESRAQ
ncbi:MAG: hypothetical protein DCC68_01980 [Planctomycetota bacterium]|nr:MAG: hypothetical protein DCC68_01980 [Planctomycetota bacterium]